MPLSHHLDHHCNSHLYRVGTSMLPLPSLPIYGIPQRTSLIWPPHYQISDLCLLCTAKHGFLFLVAICLFVASTVVADVSDEDSVDSATSPTSMPSFLTYSVSSFSPKG